MKQNCSFEPDYGRVAPVRSSGAVVHANLTRSVHDYTVPVVRCGRPAAVVHANLTMEGRVKFFLCSAGRSLYTTTDRSPYTTTS